MESLWVFCGGVEGVSGAESPDECNFNVVRSVFLFTDVSFQKML